VHTAQYGWVYMPYGDQYAHAHPGGAYAYAYVYYPAFGWRWLAAPWIIGSGPYPYFGARGPFAYSWYGGLHRAGHPWGAHYARLHDRPWVGPRAVVPARPAHGVRATTVRAPVRVQAPARVHTPARPAFAPRTVPTPRPTVLAQRNVGSAMRGPIAARGSFGTGRAVGRR
jgi:hypothetical protein